MVTSCPRAPNAFAAAIPATPAPITHTFFCLTMVQPHRSNSAERFRCPRLSRRNSRVHAHIHGAANRLRRPVNCSPVLKSPGSGTLGVGVLGQEIHFVLGGDADDFADK